MQRSISENTAIVGLSNLPFSLGIEVRNRDDNYEGEDLFFMKLTDLPYDLTTYFFLFSTEYIVGRK